MVRQHLKLHVSKETSQICNDCRGKYWDPTSQQLTQANVKKAYGIIANKCVNGEGGIMHCPYAK